MSYVVAKSVFVDLKYNDMYVNEVVCTLVKLSIISDSGFIQIIVMCMLPVRLP